jgi:hypothetical protein
MLPAILVFILAITQGAICVGRDGAAIEKTELRAAVNALRDMEATLKGDALQTVPEITGSPVQISR